jgi:F-box/leucine-rich repeat protein 6
MESPAFPLLEKLSVTYQSVDYKLVDDEALGRILKGSTCLRLLDVRGCIRITDSGLIKVPAWDLQHLFLSGKFHKPIGYCMYMYLTYRCCFFAV